MNCNVIPCNKEACHNAGKSFKISSRRIRKLVMSKISLLVRLAALLTDLAKLSHAKRDYSGFAAPDLSGLGWLATGQRWGTEAPRIDVCPSGENGGADTFVSGYQVKVGEFSQGSFW